MRYFYGGRLFAEYMCNKPMDLNRGSICNESHSWHVTLIISYQSELKNEGYVVFSFIYDISPKK